jgi:hypothetical protein
LVASQSNHSLHSHLAFGSAWSFHAISVHFVMVYYI